MLISVMHEIMIDKSETEISLNNEFKILLHYVMLLKVSILTVTTLGSYSQVKASYWLWHKLNILYRLRVHVI